MNKPTIAVILIALSATFILICLQGDAVSSTEKHASHDEHVRHEESKAHEEHEENDVSDHGHAGHAHGEQLDLDMSIEEIMTAECEHDMKTVDCTNCRFEVGVVEVDDDLLKSNNLHGLLEIKKLTMQKAGTPLSTTGEIRLNENKTVHVRSRISGVVTKVHVDYGAKVKRGDPLATINSIELGKSIANYLKAKSMTELTQQTYERENKLFEKKISSEKEMLEAKAVFESYKIEMEAAKRELRLYGLGSVSIDRLSEESWENNGFTNIYAPMDGTIIKMSVVTGELITPENEIFIITDTSSLWAWADIYERDLGKLLTAYSSDPVKASLSVQAFTDRVFEGKVDYIGAMADVKTRTVKVRVAVENSNNLLRPGMFCDISILTESMERALLAPDTAVLNDEADSFVFKKMKNNLFVRRRVVTGANFGAYVELLEGAAPGEEIITSGAFILKSDILRSKMGAGCAD